MNISVCTTITSSSTTIGETVEKVTYEFNILSEISPNMFRVSGDCNATVVSLDYLESTLAGTLFLIEYDGRYRRILTWLWQYMLSRDRINAFQVGVEVPDKFQSGSLFWIIGGVSPMEVRQTVLERRWSGRMYILGHRKKPLMLCSYLWQDTKKGLADLLGCWKRR